MDGRSGFRWSSIFSFLIWKCYIFTFQQLEMDFFPNKNLLQETWSTEGSRVIRTNERWRCCQPLPRGAAGDPSNERNEGHVVQFQSALGACSDVFRKLKWNARNLYLIFFIFVPSHLSFVSSCCVECVYEQFFCCMKIRCLPANKLWPLRRQTWSRSFYVQRQGTRLRHFILTSMWLSFHRKMYIISAEVF